MADLLIKKAVRTDVKAIADCVNPAYHRYIGRLGKPPGPMLDDYNEVVKNHIVYMAQDRERIVGVVIVVEQDASILLDNLAVTPVSQN